MQSRVTWVFLFYLFAFSLVSAVCIAGVREIFFALSLTDVVLSDSFLSGKMTLVNLIGVLLSVSILIYVVLVNKLVNNFLFQCIEELQKVVWPSVREVKKSTILVIVICAIAAVVLGFFDFAFGWLSSKNFFLE